jgi:hypothetical protein
MGRKKRKAVVDEGGDPPEEPADSAPPAKPTSSDAATAAATAAAVSKGAMLVKQFNSTNAGDTIPSSGDNTEKKTSSGYAMTTHSAEILDEDVYVSDGSESDEDLMAEPRTQRNEDDSDDDNEEGNENHGNGEHSKNPSGRSIEMVLGASKMGLMKRGIHHHSALVQPNRQWARQMTNSKDATVPGKDSALDQDGEGAAAEEERRKREQEEELAKLDPAQRAARLLAEKQRKLEEAKITARRLESEENAGRDPCLFSKRTSFDIRFDQIDDKPWERGGDMSDYFNYGFSEEDWLEYAEQQLMIRQELIDASRQKRQPDPGIVPVIPKTPKNQTPKVAVVTTGSGDDEDIVMDDANGNVGGDNAPVAGPVLVKAEDSKRGDESADPNSTNASEAQGPVKNEATEFVDVQVGAGGAWGAGAAPGSMLARLIEEQEQQLDNQYENEGGDSVMDDASHSHGGGGGDGGHGSTHDEASVTSFHLGGGGDGRPPRDHYRPPPRGPWNHPTNVAPPPEWHGSPPPPPPDWHGGPPTDWQGGHWNGNFPPPPLPPPPGGPGPGRGGPPGRGFRGSGGRFSDDFGGRFGGRSNGRGGEGRGGRGEGRGGRGGPPPPPPHKKRQRRGR